MRIDLEDTGNAMHADGIARLSTRIDVAALREYRLAVRRRTRAIVAALQPEELKRRADPARLEPIRAQGAVADEAAWLLEYWDGLTTAGLLLMPQRGTTSST
jgi:hypothetical protein